MTRRRWIAEHWDEATATILARRPSHLAACCAPSRHGRPMWSPAAMSSTPRLPLPLRVRSAFNLIAEVEADPRYPLR